MLRDARESIAPSKRLTRSCAQWRTVDTSASADRIHPHEATMSTTPPSPTQRDEFAGQIFCAMLIAPKQPGVSRLEMEDMALAAYGYADALLRARTKSTEHIDR